MNRVYNIEFTNGIINIIIIKLYNYKNILLIY